MIDNEKLTALWTSIDTNLISDTKSLFERNADALVEFLIEKTLENDRFEIGLFEEGRQSGSTLTYEDKHGQKTLELRFKKNSAFELILTIENSHGESTCLKSKLSEDEARIIPQHIRELMYKVREIALPMSFYNKAAEG